MNDISIYLTHGRNTYKNLELFNGYIVEVGMDISVSLSNKRNLIERIEKSAIEIQKDTESQKQDIDLLDGYTFEKNCADLLKENGYENVNVTPGSGDQGVDILAERFGIKYAVQCKHYSQAVGNKAVQEIYAGMKYYHCHVGIVMTNNYFTQSAKDLAKENGVILWDRDFILKLSGRHEEICESRKSEIVLSPNSEEPKTDKDIIEPESLKSENEVKKHVTDTENDLFYESEKAEFNNYDFDAEIMGKKIYPQGVYIVGKDIEVGNYFLQANKDGLGSANIYKSYDDYIDDKLAKSFMTEISGKCRIPLLREGTVIYVCLCNLIKE